MEESKSLLGVHFLAEVHCEATAFHEFPEGLRLSPAKTHQPPFASARIEPVVRRVDVHVLAGLMRARPDESRQSTTHVSFTPQHKKM